MKSLIVIDNTEIKQDSQCRYCLNDLHQAAGGENRHRPTYWLSNQQTQELIHEISKDGIPSILTKQGLGTFVCKELVYAYAMWVSPKFHLHVIRSFERVVNQEKSTALLPNFTNPAEAARAWAEQYEKRKQSEQQLALMKPKADFVDHYVEVGTTKSLREVAKILKMPEKAMITRLIEDKCLYRQSGNLLPYQTTHSKALFVVKTGTAEHGHNFTQTRVTAKGIEWIAQRYASELML